MKLLRKLFGAWETVKADVVDLHIDSPFHFLDRTVTRTLLVEKHSRTGEERAFLINIQNEREPAEIHMSKKRLGLD
jgi:hypothetical protein